MKMILHAANASNSSDTRVTSLGQITSRTAQLLLALCAYYTSVINSHTRTLTCNNTAIAVVCRLMVYNM